MNEILNIDISKQDHNDLISFCKLNEISDIDGFIKLCFRKGLMIEKYGLLNQGNLPDIIERELEKEVIKEVIVEKEVFIEKPVIDNEKVEELQNEIYILKSENSNLKNSIKLLEEKIKKQELIEESLRKHFKEKTIKYDEILDRLKQKIASLEIYNSNHKLEKKSLSLTSRTSMTNFTTKARELRQSIDNKLSKNYVLNVT